MKAALEAPTAKATLSAIVVEGFSLPSKRMTEEEFEAWCDEDVAAEYVDGEVIVHSPVRVRHSELALFLASLMKLVVDGQAAGRVMGPEVQTRLRPGLRRIPNVMFIARARSHLVLETRIDGAPDLAIEIVSPDSVERDWQKKYLEYQAAGVREYWIVDPQYQQIRVYVLGTNGLYNDLEVVEGWLRSTVLSGFAIRPAWLWQEPLPQLLGAFGEITSLPMDPQG
jgi:Uma2 family endonuclease